ncbi:2-keto-4-pentenoate hydratase [Burkholderia sp. MSh2]|uniref:2-keto-4-pentenoate hydratase n=1 Tax=Burkholderia paludis TaxID=1506587 RepID=A0A6J5DU11_9BURK|nr:MULTISPECIES: 2-keto-4-pentenoate hydratase [Burkholderia]KEZ07366.1 2-keto-4-pentenoate hydratase [Burkholderia sp. MSh2]CAB3756396.1 2-keto-4-pentenoate hydratase [Burkholderia paludis]VWB61862.1 2-keto-4-pentenoate hydratase [Burkholderia paludis]
MTQATHDLAARLAAGWQHGIAFAALPPELVPAGADAAYAVQAQLLRERRAAIGAWKVGAKQPDGPIQGAPLPDDCRHASGVTLPRGAFRPLGLELEIAFRFGRDFTPREAAYTDDDVFDAIAQMGAAIEIVASRFHEWPDVAPAAQLADLQNHGALVLGEMTGYRADFPFVAPAPAFTFDGHDITGTTPGANPAGDPRRLLPWLVNHASRRGIALPAGTVVTTGSYTGMFFPQAAGTAVGRIAGLPPVSVTLA